MDLTLGGAYLSVFAMVDGKFTQNPPLPSDPYEIVVFLHLFFPVKISDVRFYNALSSLIKNIKIWILHNVIEFSWIFVTKKVISTFWLFFYIWQIQISLLQLFLKKIFQKMQILFNDNWIMVFGYVKVNIE